MPSLNIGFRSPLSGKRKERSQICEVLTDDGRWIDKEFPALYSCVDDEVTGTAFHLDGENLFLDKDGTWHQLLTEKSEIPICLRKQSMYQNGDNDEKELADLGDDIFKIFFDQRIAEALSKADDDSVVNKMIWIVGILCGTALVFGAIHYFG